MTTAQATAGRAPVFPGSALAAGYGVVAVGLLALAVRAGVPVTVLGLACLGLAHVALELRYVIGRFSGTLTRVVLPLLFAMLTGLVLCRVLTNVAPAPGRYAEIVLGYGVLAMGAFLGMRGTRRWAVLTVVGIAAACSLASPAWHFFVLTHIHNLVPVVFLWDWAERLRRAGERGAFRLVQLGWAFGLPALVLLGTFDPWLRAAAGAVASLTGTGASVLAASAPPGATPIVALRCLVIFAFLQSMHYVTWIGFLPVFGRDATAAFERRFPALRGWRFWALLLASAAALAGVFFGVRYAEGKSLYALVASYHVYLELPLLLVVAAGAANRPPGTPRHATD